MAPLSVAAGTAAGRGGSCAEAAGPATRQSRARKASRIALIGDHFGLVQLQRELEVARFVTREVDWIPTGVAGRAVRASLCADRAEQSFEAQIGHAVGIE